MRGKSVMIQTNSKLQVFLPADVKLTDRLDS